jgi:hypothetical protein
MDISDEVQKIPGHESPFEADSLFVGTKNSLAPVDDVNGVHVLLVLCHSLEGEIGIIGSKFNWSYMLVKW